MGHPKARSGPVLRRTRLGPHSAVGSVAHTCASPKPGSTDLDSFIRWGSSDIGIYGRSHEADGPGADPAQRHRATEAVPYHLAAPHPPEGRPAAGALRLDPVPGQGTARNTPVGRGGSHGRPRLPR